VARGLKPGPAGAPLTVSARSVRLAPTQHRATRPVILRRGWRHMKLSRAVHDFIDGLKIGSSSETVRGYEGDLDLLVAWAKTQAQDSIFAFTPDLVQAHLRHQSARGLAMMTLHRYQTSIRAFARWAVLQRLMAVNPMDQVPMIRKPKRLPRPFKRAERERIMALELPLAQQLVRALLYYTGLRVGPLSRIRIRDIELFPETGRGSLRSIGKKNKEHIVPIPRELGLLLEAYLEGQRERMFLLQTPAGRPWDRRAIERMTRQWGERADVATCTPHRFRHTYATMLFERGGNPAKIQLLLAHADISTTMLYMEVATDELAATAQLLEGPTEPKV
jgi:site-specific recombinase XerD